jgi:surface protein
MGQLFLNCSSLESLDVSGFKTDGVTSMFNMFRGCSSLKSLDLSIFNTKKVRNMGQMFRDCSNLATINVGGDWNTEAVTESSDMFINCTSLVGGAGTTYSPDHIKKEYAHIDGGADNPGYFTAKAGDSGEQPEGDLNGDGKVDDDDLEVLVSVVMGANKDKLAVADLNHDGKVDAADIVTLVNIIKSQK